MRIWLKKLRKSKGYTQEQIAAKVGISRCYYTQIESEVASRCLRPSLAMRIADTLECDWVWFFDEKRIPSEVLTPQLAAQPSE